ncbi:MAG TPA: GNAT family N-acetyltransferase, partial [Chitinophagaceae bacterium]|nr:GNAT family N-acetyltransferase [Chitinophagaceae bacterium]
FMMNGDEEIVRYIRPPKSREESDLFLLEVIKYSQENPLYGRWAVFEKESGEFAGTFAVIPIENADNMQLGYSLIKRNWGKGYATELTLAGLQYVFTRTPLTEIYAITEAGNLASQKVLQKVGFRFQRSFEENGKELFQYQY